jgi:uncharacterized membrane protein YtjA (UPF0391 family)
MLKLAFLFAVISVITGFFGFGRVSSGAASIAKIFFFIFVALFIIVLLVGLLAGSALA